MEKRKDICCDTWRDVKVKTLVKTLADTVKETLGDFEAEALVKKFAPMVADMEGKIIGGTLRDLEAEALVDTTSDTLPEVRVRITPTF